MSKEESLQLPGVVSEILPNATYRVRLEGDHDIVAILAISGPNATLEPARGDMVLVEIKPYDLSRGRIILRLT